MSDFWVIRTPGWKLGLLAVALFALAHIGWGILDFVGTFVHSPMMTSFANGDWTVADAAVGCILLAFWFAWISPAVVILVVTLIWAPYELSLDGKGNLLVASLLRKQTIALSGIISIEYDSAPPEPPPADVSPLMVINHAGWKIELPLFKRHQDFLRTVAVAQPLIRMIDVSEYTGQSRSV